MLQTAGARTQAPCGKGTFMNTTCGAACLPCEEGTYAPGVTYSSNAANSDCYCAPKGPSSSPKPCSAYIGF